MFKIGDFSRLSRVPVKTLRYYDEIGLLKPHNLDRFTRYRYYSVEQLAVLHRILALKELGFSLEQVARLLQGDLTPAQLKRMLQQRRAEIVTDLRDAGAQLEQVDARLLQIEQDGRLPQYEVVLKALPPLLVASAGAMISGYDQVGAVFDRLFGEVYAHLGLHAVRPCGAPLAIYHDAGTVEDCMRVEIALPIPRMIPSSEQVCAYELPPQACAASLVHHGSYAMLHQSYRALLAWNEANGYRISGDSREVYLRSEKNGGQGEGAAHSMNVTEIQLPVKKIRKELTMEPRIVDKEKFYVTGMRYLGKNENQEISQVWGQFNPRRGEIRHLADDPAAYGVCRDNNQGLIDYVAGFAVTKLADIPQGMMGVEITAQTYAVFEAHGVGEIGVIYEHILKEWLPGSGYQAGDGPNFEYYGAEFDPQRADDSLLYIYMPVKR